MPTTPRQPDPDDGARPGGHVLARATSTVTTQYAFDGADRLCRVVENATGSTDLQTLANPCSDTTQTTGRGTNVSTRYLYDAAGQTRPA